MGLLDFKVSYYSSHAETTSWSAQPNPTDYRENPARIPGVPNPTDYREKPVRIPGVPNPTATDYRENPVRIPGVPNPTDYRENPVRIWSAQPHRLP